MVPLKEKVVDMYILHVPRDLLRFVSRRERERENILPSDEKAVAATIIRLREGEFSPNGGCV